jgi:hypothetical protein
MYRSGIILRVAEKGDETPHPLELERGLIAVTFNLFEVDE